MKRVSRNTKVVASCLAVITGMAAMCYAAVPLYYAFCLATGYGGTPNRAAAAPGAIGERTIEVRFDTNVDPKLPWSFQPEQRAVQVRLGEDKLVFFRATNNSDHAITGHASFNVQPDNAARYFSKIQCFCFTEQRLEAGQSIEMPVSFFVSPEIAKDRRDDKISEITLSYTFYPALDQKTASRPASDKAGG